MKRKKIKITKTELFVYTGKMKSSMPTTDQTNTSTTMTTTGSGFVR